MSEFHLPDFKERGYIPVLTIKGPWVHMIADGLKTIEIRSWKTDHRGQVALHASKTFDQESYDFLKGLDLGPVFEQSLRDEYRGHIIATADLAEVIEYDSAAHFASNCLEHYNPYDWFRPGLVGWRFENIKKVKPIPHRGTLGFSLIGSEMLEAIE